MQRGRGLDGVPRIGTCAGGQTNGSNRWVKQILVVAAKMEEGICETGEDGTPHATRQGVHVHVSLHLGRNDVVDVQTKKKPRAMIIRI